MNILAVDTSTLTGSVAVVRGEPGDAPELLASRDDAVSTHSDILLPLVADVLAAAGLAVADLGAIAVGAGPGSFTGLRIGMATAKGLAFAAGVPLWAVSSLAALAQDGIDRAGTSLIVPAIDARRDEIYAGFYRATGGIAHCVGDERVLAPADLGGVIAEFDDSTAVTFVGDGAVAFADVLGAFGTVAEGVRTTPSALSIARLALATPQTDALTAGAPTYIRKSEAELKFPKGNPGGTFSKRS